MIRLNRHSQLRVSQSCPWYLSDVQHANDAIAAGCVQARPIGGVSQQPADCRGAAASPPRAPPPLCQKCAAARRRSLQAWAAFTVTRASISCCHDAISTLVRGDPESTLASKLYCVNLCCCLCTSRVLPKQFQSTACFHSYSPGLQIWKVRPEATGTERCISGAATYKRTALEVGRKASPNGKRRQRTDGKVRAGWVP